MRSKIDYDYTETTESIEVSAQPYYLEEQSHPEDRRYVWAYRIKIANGGETPVQLLNRHWRIFDGNGAVQDVEGPGVVGERPVINPGESFEYSSFASLPTASGLMNGDYELKSDDGKPFRVNVPAFSLDSPMQATRPN